MKSSVFIVDDDELFSDMLMHYLSANRLIEVKQFATGEEVLGHLAAKPLVVILAYHLKTVRKKPENGLAILREIKKTLPNIRAVMLSSQTKYGVAAESIMEGAERYVTKDEASFDEITGIIDAILK